MNRVMSRAHFKYARQIQPRNRRHHRGSAGADEDLIIDHFRAVFQANRFLLRYDAGNRGICVDLEIQFRGDLLQ